MSRDSKEPSVLLPNYISVVLKPGDGVYDVMVKISELIGVAPQNITISPSSQSEITRLASTLSESRTLNIQYYRNQG